MQIEYEEALVESLEMIRNMEIATSQGNRLPLSALVNLRVTKGPAMIFRQDGQTSLGITATPMTDNIYTVSRKAAEIMKAHEFPRGYSWQEKGGREDYAEAMKDFMMAFAMSVILVFILMGILFESFILPVTVLLSVPFAVMGGLWLLVLSNTPLDVNSMAGFILLAGIVVNNAIVLIDRINRLRREGLPRADAVIRGGCERLRPILMTALTTIFGLLPMAVPELFAAGAASIFSYRSLAIVVLGGLAFATVFTVFVIPLAYSLLDDFSAAAVRVLARAVRARLPLAGARDESPAGTIKNRAERCGATPGPVDFLKRVRSSSTVRPVADYGITSKSKVSWYHRSPLSPIMHRQV